MKRKHNYVTTTLYITIAMYIVAAVYAEVNGLI